MSSRPHSLPAGLVTAVEAILLSRSGVDGIRGSDLLATLHAAGFPGMVVRRQQEAMAELRRRGVPAYGTAAKGYKTARTADEIAEFVSDRRKRIAAHNREIALVDLAMAARIQQALDFGPGVQP